MHTYRVSTSGPCFKRDATSARALAETWVARYIPLKRGWTLKIIDSTTKRDAVSLQVFNSKGARVRGSGAVVYRAG
jgi:hypothetical protein